MKREVSCTLAGNNVVRKFVVTEDDGRVHSETISVQGDKDTVLENLEKQVAEAKRDRDGILNPTAKPSPSDGTPGEEIAFWLSGNVIYKTTTTRNSAGKFQNQQSRPEGARSQRLENAEERLAELTKELDAVKNAK